MTRIRSLLLLGFLAFTPGLMAQSGRLDLRLDHLTDRADEVVDINLEGPTLRLASRFLSSTDPEERGVRDIVQSLSGIFVKSFTFDKPGAYSAAEVEAVRRQLDKSWQRIVTVKSKSSDNVEIYIQPAGDMARGLVIIATEPLELTIVQIIGTIDLARLAELEGEFGIPEMDLETSTKKGK